MKWFKHDTTSLHDAKIEKLIMKYGIEGYGVYFACIELIAHDISKKNVTFELEHDAELLAHKFKVDTVKLEEIMLYCINIGLFGQSDVNGRITCMKLATRIDDSMVKNPEMKKIQEEISVKINENQNKSNQIRLDKIRLEKNIETANSSKEYIDTLSDNEKEILEERIQNIKETKKELDDTFPDNKTTKFKKPTIEDIQQYLTERKIKHFTSDYFYDYYESKGWMVGKNKMKDWKAAVRTWQQNNYGNKEEKSKYIEL